MKVFVYAFLGLVLGFTVLIGSITYSNEHNAVWPWFVQTCVIMSPIYLAALGAWIGCLVDEDWY